MAKNPMVNETYYEVKGKKISKVMKEFKKGELNIGKSAKKVKSKKQAIAIALSQAGGYLQSLARCYFMR